MDMDPMSKAIEQARVFGLDMVILFLHALHAL
jgi:hypothetical protein